ncbi:acylphosphatase [Nostoc sp. UHCC 0302]|uniref:acylphosphatase n=1 Tax=Nostoc sp. UHCC 0302 TaxID=3134896 RepID=UPI00311CBD60
MIAYIVKHLLKQFSWVTIILMIALFTFQNVVLADEPPATDSMVALHGIITGKVQKVGFRAFLFKLAIQYNLAGWDQNLSDGTVEFIWQGQQPRIDQAIAKIPTGDTSAIVNQVLTKSIPVIPGLNTFVVRGWTSVSRNYFQPTDLTFTLRDDNSIISAKAAQKIYKNTIRPIVGDK